MSPFECSSSPMSIYLSSVNTTVGITYPSTGVNLLAVVGIERGRHTLEHELLHQQDQHRPHLEVSAAPPSAPLGPSAPGVRTVFAVTSVFFYYIPTRASSSATVPPSQPPLGLELADVAGIPGADAAARNTLCRCAREWSARNLMIHESVADEVS